MTLSKHDQKRRARFEAAGLTGSDLAYADTSYVGAEESACCLCDTRIIHNFVLTFDLPDERGRVVMEPVGSQCITDWMRAFPPSPERDAALAKVKRAERERDRMVRRAKRRETLLASLDRGEARALRRYFDAPKAVQEDETLADIAGRVERRGGFASDKQYRFFAAKLREALLAAPQPDQAPAKPEPAASTSGLEVPPLPPELARACPACGKPWTECALACDPAYQEGTVGWVMRMPADGEAAPEEEPPAEPAPEPTPASPADRAAALGLDDDATNLMRRYYALPAGAACATLIDIADRVETWDGFASDRQRRFFAVKLRDAERAAKGAPARRRPAPQIKVGLPEHDDFPW